MKEFLKIEAAGNDFIFGRYERPLTVREIMWLCDRNFGIGGDGVVMMDTIDATRSRWYFYNRDGSEAAMCGNAARAAAAWLKSKKVEFPHRLITGFGEISLEKRGEDFAATVAYAQKPLSLQPIRMNGEAGLLIDTGVPHVVVKRTESVHESIKTNRESMRELALRLRWPVEAGPEGSNVTFYRPLSDNAIEAVTFERGVEDFTLACGTGVLAAATVAADVFASGKPWPVDGVEVHTPGGVLKVESPDFPWSLVLVGSARIVFTAQLERTFS